MSRFKSYDEYALQQMAGRPMASQGLDFAAHAPRSPFGGQTPFSPFQAGGGQGQSPQGLVGRAGQGGPQFQTRTSDGHSFVSRVGGGGMNAFGNGRSDLQYGNRAGGGEASGWEMSRDAMLSDMSNIQGAGDRMFDRLQGNNQGMNDLVGGLQGRIEGSANREAGRMDQFAKQLEDPNGQGQADFNKANQYAEDAVNTQKRAESEYKDDNAANMASQSEAIQRSFQSQMNQIENSDMTPDEKRSAQFELKGQMRSQVAAAMAPLATRGQEMLAGLKNNLAMTQMAAANQTGNVGAQRSQVLGMAQRAREFSANMRNAGVMAAAQMEMQGRGALAEMIRGNPETVVSKFQGLMSLYGADQAYGLSNRGNSWGAPQQSSHRDFGYFSSQPMNYMA